MISPPLVLHAKGIEDLHHVASLIVLNWEYPVLLLQGPMGAGKTTLAKVLCQQLNVIDTVSSPTFSLVNEYATETGEVVFHFDFYRIDSVEEAESMGFEEYIDSGNKCLVEWAEKVAPLLPTQFHMVTISVTPTGRTFQFKTITP